MPPDAPDVNVDDITGATPLGKLLLKASDEATARAIIDAADSQITVSDITDATAIGRSILTASSAAAARTTLAAAGSPINVADIANATALGRQILLATTDTSVRTLINAALKQPILLQDVYTWSGTQTIASNAFFNVTSLPFTLQTGGDVGSIRDTSSTPVFKLPTKSYRTLVLCRLSTTGTVPGTGAREFKVQVRRPDGTTQIGSNSTVKVAGVSATDITGRDQNLVITTSGASDVTQTNGFMIGILNETGQTMTITALTFTINRVLNLE